MRVSHRGDKPTRHRPLAIITPIALIAGGMIAATPAVVLAASPAAASVTAPSAAVNWIFSCGKSFIAGKQKCFVIKNAAAHPAAQPAGAPAAIPAGTGYGPSQLQSAYNLTAASAADGSGTTVAVVDAFNDPTAAADLATYRSAAGLPALTAGQFTVYNQNGQTSPLPATAPVTDDWTLEESLDIDMVSAICPKCKIDLVEASSDSGNGLFVAEQTAATTLGAKYISNSWGGSETSSDTSMDSQYFGVSGVVYTASAGDSAYSAGVIYPATSPHVVGVGGTTLNTSSNARGWTESVWKTSSSEGTGSGCSAFEPTPSWQASISLITAACSHRVDNDVAADADPNTGAAVYDTTNGNGGWNEVGGTSESSPIIAAVFALAGNNGNGGNNAAQSIYTHTANLNEVTASNNGTCTPPAQNAVLCTATGAANTYNGPTGWGTPNGLTAFQTNGSTGGNTVTVTNPGNQTTAVGTAVSLQIHATDSASGQTLTYSATGLPAGLSINASTGLISGTPTTASTNSVTVTAKDTTNASGSASFTWTITSSGGGGCTAAQLLGNPGFETGSAAPWTSTAGVINPNGAGETSHSGTWYAWLDGYGTTHTDTLAQSVTIPASCVSATFSFWLHIDTSETTTTTAFDTLKVQVLNSSGTVLSTLGTFSNLNHVTGYAQHSFSLSSFIGQTITLKFTGTEDSSLQTSFVVDDNALNVN
ncbi:MAG TPA: putative Ig domain-containing protein [Streptosporangiaceae bacterium]|nr:putative Ig domain-containing protein [Streptosporangiaceae bacterium]